MIPEFVRAVVERDGKYLVIREKKRSDGWNFPGGKIDEGESSVNAVVRELGEETGLFPKQVVPLFRKIFHIDGVPWHGIFFKVEAEGEPEIQEPDKCLEMKWVTAEELAELPCLEGALRIQ